MKTVKHSTEICVVGGGIAGLCAAIAAARHGAKTILVQDRPVLGGNASSEIRMWICSAHGKDNRETGIVEELTLENFYQNPGLKYPLWDSVLYEKAILEPNLTLLLNTSCLDAVTENNRIKSIKAWQSNAETWHDIKAAWFADCSGDSILAPLTGAEFMLGREAKADFNESIAPDIRDNKTMGMSCLFQIRETPGKTVFIPPVWAYRYPSDEDLPYKSHGRNSNFWWIELGGDGDSLHDTDKYRDELLKIAYGVWDHMKNHGDHGVENWELEWIGFLPGKRESRRYVGKHIITQNDVETEGRFDDIVAYGGWTMDDHFPKGFYHDGPGTIHHPAPSPWGIPLRSLYSNNIENLVFAGRNISTTHAAMSSSRVMATCGIMGQAVGTAVAMALKDNTTLEGLEIPKLQQQLMDDDCYIPWHKREVSALSRNAVCNAGIVRSGVDRGEDNLWIGAVGEYLEYTFEKPQTIAGIRLVFDSNLNRNYQNMPCNYPLEQTRFHLPESLVKEYKIVGTKADGKEVFLHITDNHQRFVRHKVEWENILSVKLTTLTTWGDEKFRVFGFEVE